MKTINIWLIATIAAIAISATYMLDGPSDHEASLDVAADVEQAKQDARKAKRLERAQ